MVAKSIFTLILYSFLPFLNVVVYATESPLLSKEENYWLATRNDTIVIYPEKNYPPFSYQSASGIVQGMSIDFIELVAQNIGAKIHYAVPRSQSQIIADLKNGKGDVALSITPSQENEQSFLFTESFVKVPVVIVVRKDVDSKNHVAIGDYVGKKVAVVAGSSAEEFIRKNYPRVIVETVTDNEVGLQQTVLGEVDAVVMDVGSLSFLLSKQVISSVKIAGSLGFDYEQSFAIPKDKAILQSILEKGMMQISTADREALSEKWILIPGDTEQKRSFFSFLQKDTILILLYTTFLLGIIAVLVIVSRPVRKVFNFRKKDEVMDSLVSEVKELEAVSNVLEKELREIEEKEKEIVEKINEIKD